MNFTELHILHGQTPVGVLSYDHLGDKIELIYEESWRFDSESFPVSVSLPLSEKSHSDEIVRSFLQGLLPDNAALLDSWGKRFQVSPRNPFNLIKNVGEDCAGAVQFVRPERLDLILSGKLDSLTLLTEEALAERISNIKAQASSIPVGTLGRFSLAGAQTKDALYRRDGQWYVPTGRIPSTHILKPQLKEFEAHHINEHFCLELAAQIEIPTANSEIIQIAGENMICVERYDRFFAGDGTVYRIHQEDTCQALGFPPSFKYQTDGGPSALSITALLKRSSDDKDADIEKFITALALNWVIVGTDAHSKNYSLLHGPGSVLRLAPLYDIASYLPYQKDPKSRKIKLAMKIGNTYHLHKIDADHWKTWADDAGLDPEEVVKRVRITVERILNSLEPVTNRIAKFHDSPFVPRLADLIRERARFCAGLLG